MTVGRIPCGWSVAANSKRSALLAKFPLRLAHKILSRHGHRGTAAAPGGTAAVGWPLGTSRAVDMRVSPCDAFAKKSLCGAPRRVRRCSLCRFGFPPYIADRIRKCLMPRECCCYGPTLGRVRRSIGPICCVTHSEYRSVRIRSNTPPESSVHVKRARAHFASTLRRSCAKIPRHHGGEIAISRPPKLQ